LRDEELEQMDERMQTDGMIDRATQKTDQPKVDLPHLEGKDARDSRMQEEPSEGESLTENVGVEAAEEVADPVPTTKVEEGRAEADRREEGTEGSWLGTLAIVLSVLSLLLVPYILAPAGIVLGIISGTRKNQLGWWAVGVGAFSLIVNLAAAPYLRLY
jgi:hypothetical protein